MAHFTYVLFESAVYNSAGSKLRDAIEKYNSMNQEAYNTLQSLQNYMNKNDPNLNSKLDKAIGYLQNIQSVYSEMDRVIDKYMADEMKNTPEIASTIKKDCESTKETIATLREKDKSLLDFYTKQKASLNGSEKSKAIILGITKKLSELIKSHNAGASKIGALGRRLTPNNS